MADHDQVTYCFQWDEFENTGLVMILNATATQGDRTLPATEKRMNFRVEHRYEPQCR